MWEKSSAGALGGWDYKSETELAAGIGSLLTSSACSGGWLRGLSSSDLRKKREEALFTRGTDLPVYGNALESLIEAFTIHSEIEIAPAGAFAEGGEEVVVGLVEVEVVVLVEEDRLVVIALEGPGFVDHFADAVGIVDAVAVEQ